MDSGCLVRSPGSVDCAICEEVDVGALSRALVSDGRTRGTGRGLADDGRSCADYGNHEAEGDHAEGQEELFEKGKCCLACLRNLSRVVKVASSIKIASFPATVTIGNYIAISMAR